MALKDYDLKKVALFVIIVVAIVVGLIGTGSGVYYYIKYKKTVTKLQNTSLVSGEQVKALVEEIGKLIKLPEGEDPTLATITNLESVKDKPFFANAKVGNKLLIYNNAKKVFLYDPIEKKIVEVGPLIITSASPSPQLTNSGSTNVLNLSTESSQIEPTPLPTPIIPQVAILNGTNNKSLTSILINQLRTQIKNIRVKDKGPITKEYGKTTVYDISGIYKQTVNQLAQSINAEISAVPSDLEIPPESYFF